MERQCVFCEVGTRSFLYFLDELRLQTSHHEAMLRPNRLTATFQVYRLEIVDFRSTNQQQVSKIGAFIKLADIQ